MNTFISFLLVNRKIRLKNLRNRLNKCLAVLPATAKYSIAPAAANAAIYSVRHPLGECIPYAKSAADAPAAKKKSHSK